MSRKTYLIWGAIFCCLSIILGAFGAHYFEPRLEPSSLNAYETACTYMMYHGLALLLLVCIDHQIKQAFSKFIFIGIVLGTCMFSGSILLLATRSFSGLQVGFMGPITPLGGLILILSWIGIIVTFIRLKSNW